MKFKYALGALRQSHQHLGPTAWKFGESEAGDEQVG